MTDKGRTDPRERRRPTLADRFLAAKPSPICHPRVNDQIWRGVMHAEKFRFGAEAARRVARVVMEVPDLLVREHRFARAPYDLTWIEFPALEYWTEFRNANPEAYDAAGKWGSPDTADTEVGFLIDHGRINVISRNRLGADPLLTLLQYRLHTEWPIEDQLEFCRRAGASRVGVDVFLWGSTWEHLNSDERRALRAYNVAEFVPVSAPFRDKLMADGGMGWCAKGAVGELRTVIAMLLMLNRPSMTEYKHRAPNSRGFIGNKLRPFMSYTTVDVSMDASPRMRLIGSVNDDAGLRRRHPVRGHYCHDQTARDYMRIAGCVHDWRDCHADWTPWQDAPPDDVDHWRCAVCEGKRWWRRDHERGTTEQGLVVHDGYEVTDCLDQSKPTDAKP